MGHGEEGIASQYAATPTKQQMQPSTPAPDRQSTASTYSRSTHDGLCSRCSSRNNSRTQNYRTSQPTSPQSLGSAPTSDKDQDVVVDQAPYSPPPFSSPSPASSIGCSQPRYTISPLRRELPPPTTTVPVGIDAVTARAARHDIARRLSQLARRLAYDGPSCMNEVTLGDQLEQLERVVCATLSPGPKKAEHQHNFESPVRSDAAGSALGSPASSLYRSRFSDLSASLHREREAEKEEPEEEPPPKKGMSVAQAKKVIAELSKLNDELSAVVNNLRARQEETEHIQGLLIERAERAAQRIIFLQNRITYLEQELQENDDELQHLRICLKAVEIQMPPHPDKELQRCIATFKDEYQALKRKRAHAASIAIARGFASQQLGSPTR